MQRRLNETAEICQCRACKWRPLSELAAYAVNANSDILLFSVKKHNQKTWNYYVTEGLPFIELTAICVTVMTS